MEWELFLLFQTRNGMGRFWYYDASHCGMASLAEDKEKA
jgi:hypothetical protein